MKTSLIKNIFDKKTNFKLKLNNEIIVLDFDSYSRILSRHFRKDRNKNEISNSHFTPDIKYNKIHLTIKNIFNQIDKSKLYINQSISEIYFKYKNIYYAIFTGFEKSNEMIRINSFFPIENENLIKKLQIEYAERNINDGLSIFI